MMTPMTEATAAIQLNSAAPIDKATAVNAGRSDWGRDIGRAFFNQKESFLFIGDYSVTVWVSDAGTAAISVAVVSC